VRSPISEQLVRRSVVRMACTIPPEMTIAQWWRQRASGPRQKGPRLGRLLAAASRLVSLPATPCGHLHDSTTRYDHDQTLLTFVLVCPVCRTEKVIETQHYEPRFEPSPAQRADAADGATIHQLPVRRLAIYELACEGNQLGIEGSRARACTRHQGGETLDGVIRSRSSRSSGTFARQSGSTLRSPDRP
jgi:hypothetical protein